MGKCTSRHLFSYGGLFTRQIRVYQHEKVGEKVGENRGKFYLSPTVCQLVCRLFLCRSHTPTWVCQHEFAIWSQIPRLNWHFESSSRYSGLSRCVPSSSHRLPRSSRRELGLFVSSPTSSSMVSSTPQIVSSWSDLSPSSSMRGDYRQN